MKKTLLALSLAALSLPLSLVHAESYQLEVGMGLVDADLDGVDMDRIGLDATWYLAPVNTDGLVYGEAAFLNRATNLSAFLYFDDYEGEDVDQLGVQLEAFLGNFYVAGGLAGWDADHDEGVDTAVRVGFLPQDGMLLTAGIARQEQGWGEKVRTISVDGKYVTRMDGHTVNVEAGVAMSDDHDDTKVLHLAGDYYLNRQLSIGALGSVVNGDGTDLNLGMRASYFLTSRVSVQGLLQLGDEEILGLRVAGRF